MGLKRLLHEVLFEKVAMYCTVLYPCLSYCSMSPCSLYGSDPSTEFDSHLCTCHFGWNVEILCQIYNRYFDVIYTLCFAPLIAYSIYALEYLEIPVSDEERSHV